MKIQMTRAVRLMCMMAVTAVVLGVSGCGKPSVSVELASLSEVLLTIEQTVTPEAAHSAPVIPMVTGKIQSEIPDVGTKVKAGQVLFQVDSSKYQAQAAGLRAQIAASARRTVTVQSAGGGAPIDNSMEASLLKQGIITRAEYNRIKGRNASTASSQTVTTTGGVAPAGLTASLQSLEKAIADCSIRAPIDGVVSAVYAANDKIAVAGKPALIIRQDSPVAANLELPARLDKVMDKAKDTKTLTVTLTDGKNIWYAELTRQEGQGDKEISAYRVQADNPDGQIVIGKNYKLRIETGQDAPCFIVPAKAILPNSQVAIVTADNLIDFRTVVTAGKVGNNVLILSGLKEGEQVVTNPPEGLEIGTPVDVQ